MTETRSILEYMIDNKLAENQFAASRIYDGLKLSKCRSFEQQVDRVKLYRRWRAKTDVKNDIPAKQAFDLAIAGIDPVDVEIRQIEFNISMMDTE